MTYTSVCVSRKELPFYARKKSKTRNSTVLKKSFRFNFLSTEKKKSFFSRFANRKVLYSNLCCFVHMNEVNTRHTHVCECACINLNINKNRYFFGVLFEWYTNLSCLFHLENNKKKSVIQGKKSKHKQSFFKPMLSCCFVEIIYHSAVVCVHQACLRLFLVLLMLAQNVFISIHKNCLFFWFCWCPWSVLLEFF